ncbi:MAG: hypothetical protein HYV60_01240 [Planctomycetia bacterium]|nr:hypothetical protein [Planctomycetia bacterium]
MGPNAGLWGVAVKDDERQRLGIDKDDLGIRVTYIHKPWSRAAGLKLKRDDGRSIKHRVSPEA